jgi:hypothetical protein
MSQANRARITIENFYTNFILHQDERKERQKTTENAICKFFTVLCLSR